LHIICDKWADAYMCFPGYEMESHIVAHENSFYLVWERCSCMYGFMCGGTDIRKFVRYYKNTSHGTKGCSYSERGVVLTIYKLLLLVGMNLRTSRKRLFVYLIMLTVTLMFLFAIAICYERIVISVDLKLNAAEDFCLLLLRFKKKEEGIE